MQRSLRYAACMRRRNLPIVETPAGRMVVGRRDGQLATDWEVGAALFDSPHADSEILDCAARLKRYFAGNRSAIDAIPTGRGTPFQVAVWTACRAIPWGETRTYGWIAKRLRKTPVACRAVGQALRRNPLSVIVPCHRVVGANGPGGYAGKTDGPLLRVKRSLLELESASTNLIRSR